MTIRIQKSDLLSKLDVERRQAVIELDRAVKSAGYECYLVGGVVRDLLMGRSPGDCDFATNAHPESVRKIFRRTVPTGIKHGTITVLLGDQAFEVTTYRSESAYTDARRPDHVRFAETLEEDLSRRDFTVNALAFDISSGTLVDAYDGLEDIDRRLIRTIGLAKERFFEDGLRPVRACRFCATLGFTLHDDTKAALADAEVHARTAKVAVERFADELWKGFKVQNVSAMLRPLEQTGLCDLFFRLPNGRTTDEVFRRLDALFPAPGPVRFSWWWDAQGLNKRADLETLARRLKFSHKQTRDIVWTSAFIHYIRDRAAPAVADPLLAERQFLSSLKNFYKDEGFDFLQATAVLDSNLSASMLQRYAGEPLVIADLAVGGEEMKALGVEGPAIGKMLKALLDAVLAGTVKNQRADLLESAKAAIKHA